MPDQMLLFCGLFVGEGSVLLARRHHRDGQWNYRPELIMRLRSDDRPLLEWISQYIGGNVIDVYISPTSGNPMSQWYLSGWSRVEPVLRSLIEVDCVVGFPAKKMKEVQFLYQVCLLRKTMPWKLTQKERDQLEELYHKLSAIRSFQGAG